MRIAHVFNMANNGYQIVKALRRYTNIDVDLIIDSGDFGMGLPIWEDYQLNVDPYHVNPNIFERLKMPTWVKLFQRSRFSLSFGQIAHLFRMVKEYDLLHLHPFSPICLQFQRTPFVIHDAGWLRTLPFDETNTGRLGRRAYAKAESIVMTNPDLYRFLPSLKPRSEVFIPFIIDTEQYRPRPIDRDSDRPLFFSPARHNWDIKGNDRLIRAFAKYVRAGRKRAMLALVNWGSPEDIARSRQLIIDLNIDRNVEWLSPLSKPPLIDMYNRADVVFDQFVIGGYGTTAPEAMACERPVVICFLPYWNIRCYGEIAPVLSACTADEIYSKMVELEDPEVRANYGKAGREYVLRHHDAIKLAGKYASFYRVLGEHLHAG